MPVVSMFVDKFNAVVIIDDDHPLAIAQRARDIERAVVPPSPDPAIVDDVAPSSDSSTSAPAIPSDAAAPSEPSATQSSGSVGDVPASDAPPIDEKSLAMLVSPEGDPASVPPGDVTVALPLASQAAKPATSGRGRSRRTQ